MLLRKKRNFFQKLTIALLAFLFAVTIPGISIAAEDLTVENAQTNTNESAESIDENTPINTEERGENAIQEPTGDSISSDGQSSLDSEEGSTEFGDERKNAANNLKIEKDSITGALSYNYPLMVPPGRNGMQPDLKLSYNNQQNDNSNIFGYGWSVNIPYIERINRKGNVQVNEYLADPQGLNSYSYAKNNPLKYVDVTGENPLVIAVAVLGYVIYGSLVDPLPAGDNNQGFFRSFSQQMVKIGRDIALMETAGTMFTKAISVGGKVVRTLLSSEGKNIGIGFKSFGSFKRVFGPAGEGKEWHHIVEQTGRNVEKFGEEQIHNTQNLMSVSKEVNQKINAYYSSKDYFTNGQTVRQWISEQSFQKQYEFGKQILNKALKGGDLR
jgi:hypothetical protein